MNLTYWDLICFQTKELVERCDPVGITLILCILTLFVRRKMGCRAYWAGILGYLIFFSSFWAEIIMNAAIQRCILSDSITRGLGVRLYQNVPYVTYSLMAPGVLLCLVAVIVGRESESDKAV